MGKKKDSKNLHIVSSITAGNLAVFSVDSKQEIRIKKAKGTLKQHETLVLGDYVEIEKASGEFVISKILPRKNQILRPKIANIDKLIIMIATEPAPDFKLVDLLLISCFQQGIEPILCLNKMDVGEAMLRKALSIEVKRKYQHVCDIVEASAKTYVGHPSLRKLVEGEDGKTTVFVIAGQSAVGKSSTVNALYGLNIKEGELSGKIMRGKNTTTKSYFHITPNGNLLADSPGFSLIDVAKMGISQKELKEYYPDFEFGCKFSNCNHVGEDGCGADMLIEKGQFDKERLENYREFFKNLPKLVY